ncbi:hypothetical protein D3C87_2165810 [compost metagenome]
MSEQRCEGGVTSEPLVAMRDFGHQRFDRKKCRMPAMPRDALELKTDRGSRFQARGNVGMLT